MFLRGRAAQSGDHPPAPILDSHPRPVMAARWSEKQDRIVREFPPPEAARLLGRSVGAVYQRRYVLEAENIKRPWTEAEDRLIAKLPFGQAVAYTKRTEDAGRQRLVKLGLADRLCRTRGLRRGADQ